MEREEEIKEAMNDALGASQRRITDLEGELEHAKAIAAAAEKSPDQGTEEGGDSSELEKLRKKLNVSAGLVKKLRDSENDLRDELAAAQRRIAEGVKDRDAEERAVATQRNLLQKTEEGSVAALEQTLAEAESSFARERESLVRDLAAARSEAKEEKNARNTRERGKTGARPKTQEIRQAVWRVISSGLELQAVVEGAARGCTADVRRLVWATCRHGVVYSYSYSYSYLYVSLWGV